MGRIYQQKTMPGCGYPWRGKLLWLAAGCIAVLPVSSSSWAAQGVYPKAPIQMAGTGCGAEGSDTAVTENRDGSFSISFKQYVAGPGNKSCSFAIPMAVSQGYQVSSAVEAEWSGSVKGSGELSRSYFFAGGLADSKIDQLRSESGEDFLKRDGALAPDSSWSACGRDVTLRINSRIRSLTDNSKISLTRLGLRIQYRRCQAAYNWNNEDDKADSLAELLDRMNR